ncbi:hypothetical protein [Polynucleobacter sphagniphilus]|jgi:hypothetical protein|uniref:Uncharacterized protein n=1 Tax=Polynucleobacter sphagniphilus TaxID=1743169 RepID=A0AA43M7U6_9BURK|nr:hypothetical protein [Polynucleobacter sphagniphilus]MDH6502939.1 hypothetical protein [Polynucleobacter sphagniphilus]MDH6511600.1 hypothetical protein [Polynucleobacter sphagniphilus]
MSEKKQNNVSLVRKEGVTLEQQATEYILDPKTLGALIIDGNNSNVSTQVDMEYAREVIGQGIDEVKKGDLSKLEEMLYSQAVALNMMFSNLSRRASLQTNVDIKTTLTNLCFKAQNQSRNTIQTLINLKQPSQTSFIKQANIANGHQQINNGVAQSSPENLSNQSNELLEVQDGKWLDRGKKAETEGVNSELETMGEIHRGENSSGQS